MVRDGEFREDLYYRINTLHMHIPPLRERTEEIRRLSDVFISRYALKYGRNAKRISDSALEKLESYFWPGNIRELQNCLEKAVILSDRETITETDIDIPHSSHDCTQSISPTGSETLEETEEKTIRAAMTRYAGNLSMVAKSLEISRPTLYSKLKKYNI